MIAQQLIRLANGMDLEVTIGDIGYPELAAASEKVTGQPAQYIDTTLEDYFTKGPMSALADRPAGYTADLNDKGNLFERVQPENWTADSFVLKVTEDIAGMKTGSCDQRMTLKRQSINPRAELVRARRPSSSTVPARAGHTGSLM
jgi:hypothetical protein